MVQMLSQLTYNIHSCTYIQSYIVRSYYDSITVIYSTVTIMMYTYSYPSQDVVHVTCMFTVLYMHV